MSYDDLNPVVSTGDGTRYDLPAELASDALKYLRVHHPAALADAISYAYGLDPADRPAARKKRSDAGGGRANGLREVS